MLLMECIEGALNVMDGCYTNKMPLLFNLATGAVNQSYKQYL